MATIQFGGLTTTATTADQTILTYTPVNTLSLKTIFIAGYLTTYSATESNMGVVVIKQAGTNVLEYRIQNTDLDTLAGVLTIPLGDGLLFNGTDTVAVHVTPAAATSMRWTATFFFE
jgi:hypothetical protein